MASRKIEKKTTSNISEDKKETLKTVIDNNAPKTEEDLIMLVTHAVLLKNSFKCVCIGRYEGDMSSVVGLEGSALPGRWNEQDEPGCFELSYIHTEGQHLYILGALRIEDKLCFNLLEQGKSHANATVVQVDVNDHVARKDKPINIEWLNDAGFLWKLIEKGLLGKHQDLFERRDEELQTRLIEQEMPRLAERTPLSMLPDRAPIHDPDVLRETRSFQRPSPFAYGDADRLPGHPGMGGMMMDPLRSGGMGLRPPGYPGIPRGSVPPGARFDPFGPLTEFDYSSGDRRPPRSFDPNPDHLRRPGFDDDMFM